jgi:hypothetical protein
MKLIDILVRELPNRGGWKENVKTMTQDKGGDIYGYDCLSPILKECQMWASQSNNNLVIESKIVVNELSSDWNVAVITREQYEAALAANRQTKMNWKYIKGSEKDFVGAPYNETHAFMHKECCHFIYTSNPEDIRADLFSFIAQREPVAERVDGLPPVGEECEYSLNGGSTWWKCKIDYIVGTQGLVMLCDTFEGIQYVNFHSYGSALKFRPLRTEADKKRYSAIEALFEVLDAGVSTSQDAIDIYDAIAAGKIPGVILDKSK